MMSMLLARTHLYSPKLKQQTFRNIEMGINTCVDGFVFQNQIIFLEFLVLI